MIALANDEAELAAVLAHEIGHALAGHTGGRAPANRVAAEFEADRLGLGSGGGRLRPARRPTSGDAGRRLRARRPAARRGADGRARLRPGRSSSGCAPRGGRGPVAGGRGGRTRHLAAIDGMAWGPRTAGLRLRLHRIAGNEDVAAMARAMPVGNAPRARFDLLNGLRPGESLRVGDWVKLVGR